MYIYIYIYIYIYTLTYSSMPIVYNSEYAQTVALVASPGT